VHEVDVILFFISLLYLFFISAIALRYSSSSSRRRRRRRGFLSSDDGVNKCFPLSMKEEEATLSRTTTTKGNTRSSVGGSTRSLTRSLARKRKRKRERFFNGESESFCVSASNVGKNTRQIFFGASVQKSA